MVQKQPNHMLSVMSHVSWHAKWLISSCKCTNKRLVGSKFAQCHLFLFPSAFCTIRWDLLVDAWSGHVLAPSARYYANPYGLALAIISEWQLSSLTCKCRCCWDPHSALTWSKAAFLCFRHLPIVFNIMEKSKLFYSRCDFIFKMLDSWTSFVRQCFSQSCSQVLLFLKACNHIPTNVSWSSLTV